MTVTHAPNAKGQPTQVGTFATGVSYYPNGAIKQFTYDGQLAEQFPESSGKKIMIQLAGAPPCLPVAGIAFERPEDLQRNDTIAASCDQPLR